MFKSLPRKTRCLTWTAIIGFCLTIFSLVFALVLLPLIVDVFIREFVVIKNGTMAWDRFVELPFPLDFSIYFMKIENSAEVLNGAKPFITEIGPFIYKNYRKKTDIQFITDEYVSYKNLGIYEFDKERSVHPDDYEISSINFVAFAIFQLLENSEIIFEYTIENILPNVMDDYEVYNTIKVKDLLFDGIPFCHKENHDILAKAICMAIMLLNVKMIDYHDDLTMRYSLFGFRNNSDDGTFVINTGIDDITKIGEVYSWNEMQYTKFYGEENNVCNKVEGYDIGVSPPNIKKTDLYTVYVTDICRPVSLKYKGEDTDRDIDTYRFALDETTWRPEENACPNNSCYCSHYTRGLDGKESCFLDGVIDTYPCLGIPALISFPHFLHADEKYRENIDNLQPNEELHESHLQFQPFLGAPLSGYISLQMNIICRPMTLGGKIVESTKNLRSFAMPVLWLQQGITLEGDVFDLVNLALTLLLVLEILKWVFVVISGIVFMYAVVKLLIGKDKKLCC